MGLFDYWWIPFIVAGALAVGAWSMWLEHQRKQKALEVLREAIASGRDIPAPLVQALTRDKSDDDWTGASSWGGGSGGWTGVAFFAILCLGFGIAAFVTDGRGSNAFWLVSGVMAAMAVLTTVAQLNRKKP